MPLQNRVTPFSKIIKTPHRGTFMGNRGILHGDRQTLLTQKWRHKNWVICNLTHTDQKGRDWHRKVMTPHRYTELFFLDEATALAAGHRPCALCRRAAFNHYKQCVKIKFSSAKELDVHLHEERTQFILNKTPYPIRNARQVPNGAMVILNHDPLQAWLKKDRHLWRWAHSGYDKTISLPDEKIRVITPPLSLGALDKGYKVQLHCSILS